MSSICCETPLRRDCRHLILRFINSIDKHVQGSIYEKCPLLQKLKNIPNDDSYSSHLAHCISWYIDTSSQKNRKKQEFLKDIKSKLFLLCQYSQIILKHNGRPPDISEQIIDVLVKYVSLEFESVLYTQSNQKIETNENAIMSNLNIFLNEFYEMGLLNAKEESYKVQLKILYKVKIYFSTIKKSTEIVERVDGLMRKILEKFGMLEVLEEFTKNKNKNFIHFTQLVRNSPLKILGDWMTESKEKSNKNWNLSSPSRKYESVISEKPTDESYFFSDISIKHDVPQINISRNNNLNREIIDYKKNCHKEVNLHDISQSNDKNKIVFDIVENPDKIVSNCFKSIVGIDKLKNKSDSIVPKQSIEENKCEKLSENINNTQNSCSTEVKCNDVNNDTVTNKLPYDEGYFGLSFKISSSSTPKKVENSKSIVDNIQISDSTVSVACDESEKKEQEFCNKIEPEKDSAIQNNDNKESVTVEICNLESTEYNLEKIESIKVLLDTEKTVNDEAQKNVSQEQNKKLIEVNSEITQNEADFTGQTIDSCESSDITERESETQISLGNNKNEEIVENCKDEITVNVNLESQILQSCNSKEDTSDVLEELVNNTDKNLLVEMKCDQLLPKEDENLKLDPESKFEDNVVKKDEHGFISSVNEVATDLETPEIINDCNNKIKEDEIEHNKIEEEKKEHFTVTKDEDINMTEETVKNYEDAIESLTNHPKYEVQVDKCEDESKDVNIQQKDVNDENIEEDVKHADIHVKIDENISEENLTKETKEILTEETKNEKDDDKNKSKAEKIECENSHQQNEVLEENLAHDCGDKNILLPNKVEESNIQEEIINKNKEPEDNVKNVEYNFSYSVEKVEKDSEPSKTALADNNNKEVKEENVTKNENVSEIQMNVENCGQSLCGDAENHQNLKNDQVKEEVSLENIENQSGNFDIGKNGSFKNEEMTIVSSKQSEIEKKMVTEYLSNLDLDFEMLKINETPVQNHINNVHSINSNTENEMIIKTCGDSNFSIIQDELSKTENELHAKNNCKKSINFYETGFKETEKCKSLKKQKQHNLNHKQTSVESVANELSALLTNPKEIIKKGGINKINKKLQNEKDIQQVKANETKDGIITSCSKTSKYKEEIVSVFDEDTLTDGIELISTSVIEFNDEIDTLEKNQICLSQSVNTEEVASEVNEKAEIKGKFSTSFQIENILKTDVTRSNTSAEKEEALDLSKKSSTTVPMAFLNPKIGSEVLLQTENNSNNTSFITKAALKSFDEHVRLERVNDFSPEPAEIKEVVNYKHFDEMKNKEVVIGNIPQLVVKQTSKVLKSCLSSPKNNAQLNKSNKRVKISLPFMERSILKKVKERKNLENHQQKLQKNMDIKLLSMEKNDMKLFSSETTSKDIQKRKTLEKIVQEISNSRVTLPVISLTNEQQKIQNLDHSFDKKNCDMGIITNQDQSSAEHAFVNEVLESVKKLNEMSKFSSGDQDAYNKKDNIKYRSGKRKRESDVNGCNNNQTDVIRNNILNNEIDSIINLSKYQKNNLVESKHHLLIDTNDSIETVKATEDVKKQSCSKSLSSDENRILDEIDNLMKNITVTQVSRNSDSELHKEEKRSIFNSGTHESKIRNAIDLSENFLHSMELDKTKTIQRKEILTINQLKEIYSQENNKIKIKENSSEFVGNSCNLNSCISEVLINNECEKTNSESFPKNCNQLDMSVLEDVEHVLEKSKILISENNEFPKNKETENNLEEIQLNNKLKVVDFSNEETQDLDNNDVIQHEHNFSRKTEKRKISEDSFNKDDLIEKTIKKSKDDFGNIPSLTSTPLPCKNDQSSKEFSPKIEENLSVEFSYIDAEQLSQINDISKLSENTFQQEGSYSRDTFDYDDTSIADKVKKLGFIDLNGITDHNYIAGVGGPLLSEISNLNDNEENEILKSKLESNSKENNKQISDTGNQTNCNDNSNNNLNKDSPTDNKSNDDTFKLNLNSEKEFQFINDVELELALPQINESENNRPIKQEPLDEPDDEEKPRDEDVPLNEVPLEESNDNLSSPKDFNLNAMNILDMINLLEKEDVEEEKNDFTSEVQSDANEYNKKVIVQKVETYLDCWQNDSYYNLPQAKPTDNGPSNKTKKRKYTDPEDLSSKNRQILMSYTTDFRKSRKVVNYNENDGSKVKGSKKKKRKQPNRNESLLEKIRKSNANRITHDQFKVDEKSNDSNSNHQRSNNGRTNDTEKNGYTVKNEKDFSSFQNTNKIKLIIKRDKSNYSSEEIQNKNSNLREQSLERSTGPPQKKSKKIRTSRNNSYGNSNYYHDDTGFDYGFYGGNRYSNYVYGNPRQPWKKWSSSN